MHEMSETKASPPPPPMVGTFYRRSSRCNCQRPNCPRRHLHHDENDCARHEPPARLAREQQLSCGAAIATVAAAAAAAADECAAREPLRQKQQKHHQHKRRTRSDRSPIKPQDLSHSALNSHYHLAAVAVAAALLLAGAGAATTLARASTLAATAPLERVATAGHALKPNEQQQPQQQQHEHEHQQVADDVIAVKEGADLDLSCPIVVQNDDMIISWTCDNEPANIKSSRIHVTESGKLRIGSAKLGDSCNYRCEAADGYSTLSVIIKVIIVDKRLVEQLAAARASARTFPFAGSQQLGSNIASALAIDSQKAIKSQGPLQEAHAIALGGGATPTPSLGRTRQQAAGDEEARGAFMGARTANARTNVAEEHEGNSGGGDIEIFIEPAEVRVAKNKSFNLECRVVPPKLPLGAQARTTTATTSSQQQQQQQMTTQPQIIWLKEFLGPKPSSLAEALEQDLILLDDVYYHSLNWPRSQLISYAQKTSASSSALLVRHSSYVHSGRYVCFAGYPPPSTASLMANVSGIAPEPAPSAEGAGSERQSQQQQQQAAAPLTVRSLPSFKPLKYKIAQAVVKVDGDDDGERLHKMSLERAGAAAATNLADSSSNAPSPGGRHHYNRAISSNHNEQHSQQQQQQSTLTTNAAWPTPSRQSAASGNNQNGDGGFFRLITSANDWLVNLTITTSLLCALIILVKYVRLRMQRMPTKLPTSGAELVDGNADHHRHHQQVMMSSADVQTIVAIEQQQQQSTRQLLPRSLPLDENLLNLRLNDRIFNQQVDSNHHYQHPHPHPHHHQQQQQQQQQHSQQTKAKSSSEHIYSEINNTPDRVPNENSSSET